MTCLRFPGLGACVVLGGLARKAEYVHHICWGAWWGHEATDTGLAYAPVSEAHGHHHTQFNVLPCCTAAQTRSVPNVALRSPLHVAIENS